MVIAGTTFCWKAAEFKSDLLQILLQGTGFQSTCLLSPWAWLSETGLHQKSWIIYHMRRIHCNFHNLLQSRNYQEAWSLLVCKQEVFQSLSKMFVLYNFLDAMWQMQLFLAKVTLKCSYYFVCLLLKVGLSCGSLPEFFLLCFHILSYNKQFLNKVSNNNAN